ncbi:MAG: hypothetical protein AAF688_05255 [Bacteroidota bacterium]
MLISQKKILGLIVLLVIIACNDNGPVNLQKETQEKIAARTINEDDLSKIEYVEFGLSTDSRESVVDWQKYNELAVQIESLKKANIEFFNREPGLITTFTKEIRDEMPKVLQTKEISARMTALDTKIQKLNSLLRLKTASKDEKVKGIEELFIAFRNLKLQINKKFEFEKNNVFKPE